MSPSPEEFCSSCGKVKYATRKEARERLRFRSIEGGQETTVFPCPVSPTFHLGQKPRRGGQRKPRR